MPPSTAPSSLRLVLVPTVITLVVSVLRLVLEVRGSIAPTSGGGGALLGITWLALVFGAWFGWRLRRSGSAPKLRPGLLWSLLAVALMVGTAMFAMSGLDVQDTSEAGFEKLGAAVSMTAAGAAVAALFTFAVWTRLAWTLLLYAIPARVTVLALTWLAKGQGWDTHYTKFGPSGYERDMGGTMSASALAQLGFWIPFTIVAGVLAGAIGAAFAGRRAR